MLIAAHRRGNGGHIVVKSVRKTTRGSPLRTVHGPIGAVLSPFHYHYRINGVLRRAGTVPPFFPPHRALGKFNCDLQRERHKGQSLNENKSFEGFLQRRMSSQLFSGVRSPLSYLMTTADEEKQYGP